MGRRYSPGPDPLFPYLDETQRYRFPDPALSRGDIVAIGGNLSPGMLLSAYEQGIFPWYNPEDPVLWQSPDPRFIIFPEKLHISASMRKTLNRGTFTVTFDRDFPAVIRGCAAAKRPGQEAGPGQETGSGQGEIEPGQDTGSGREKTGPEQEGGGPALTWISGDIITAYTELHRLGWAHSAESWQEGELAGGCYGIRLGKVFFGESMFSRRSNASKAAFLTLARSLFAEGVRFIDCQVPTEHLRSLGGEELSRRAFLTLLRKTLRDGAVNGPDGSPANPAP
jgi:leucyl/phenylalanyl-tRNA--protein transferase